MTERYDLLTSIAQTIADYRAGDLDAPTPEHVDRWLSQFDPAVQLPMLREMDHVLKRTYFSLDRVTDFLKGLIETEKLVGNDSCAFWRSVHFLDVQGGGNSQTDILALFNEVLQEKCGFGIDDCGEESTTYLYLDDGVFTGNRVRRDLETWIKDRAPSEATLHIVSIATHSGGQYYANKYINNAAKTAEKKVDTTWWHAIELEDRKYYSATADVLRPTSIPDDEAVVAYVEEMNYEPTLRSAGSIGTKALYSSEQGKNLLEQEFLKAGVRIRHMCPNLGNTQRPLGHITLETLGFGSLIVTYRNCPNNTPLALWVGDPWYPLFPRTTNTQTAAKRQFEKLTKSSD